MKNSINFLKFSLALVFIWFGFLKLINLSPVTEIVKNSLPFLGNNFSYFFFCLAFFEIAVGFGLLFKKSSRISALLIILHLTIASLSVLLTQGFNSSFPILTLAGEFVTKNLVLIAAASVVYSKN
ncbi:hypothetical protein HY025_06230 [Candidatus Daviesbacteria bacterium]|nr:hypothetical protein [Candidatus Daviesbacteria bacterium]